MKSSLKPLVSRLAVCLAFSILAPSDATAGDWDIVSLHGNDYVSDENVAEFYGFERFARQGDDQVFKHPSLIMTWKIGADSIYVNNIKFRLSYEIAEKGGKAMLSVLDLAKLVDPVVRPSYIRKPIQFDTVVIDPGHGGHDAGAIDSLGNREKDYTLDTALRLREALLLSGFKTVLTRTDDIYLTPAQRVEVANEEKTAIFVSIHFNSAASSTENGIESYALAPQGTVSTDSISPEYIDLAGNLADAENIALATAVHAHLISDIKAVDRGVTRARFDELKGIGMPGMLVKCGFMSNPIEARLIGQPAHRIRIARSISDAIGRFQTAVGKK